MPRTYAEQALAARGTMDGVPARAAGAVRAFPRAALLLAVLLLAGLLGAACTSRTPGQAEQSGRPASSPGPSTTPPRERPTPSTGPAALSPGDVRVAVALEAVGHLAGTVGPRHGTSPQFRQAARWVASRLASIGYVVERQPFGVPVGDSWGVPVEAGRSLNVVARLPGTRLDRPHLLVGAHLDTVPGAPGAEDNASGVGALLAVADAAAGRSTRLPVVFVAFGAEEPRGPSDDDHHYGSRHYVAQLDPAERTALRGMVSLDRVGVGAVLPVCSAGPPDRIRAELLAAARRAGVLAEPCTDNRASDHWSFVRDGLPGVRLGSTPFAGYHSPRDVPAVIERAQLLRAARTVAAWLTAP